MKSIRFRPHPIVGLFWLALAAHPSPVLAQAKGEGAVVVRRGAVIYRFSKGGQVELANLPYGFAVVGVTSVGLMESFQFEEEDGRLHVKYLKLNDKGEQKSTPARAWMEPAELERFTYFCGCETGAEQNNKCSPFATSGFTDRSWNTCFREAYNAKVAELKTRRSAAASASGGEESRENSSSTLGSVVATRTWVPGKYFQQKDRDITMELKPDGSVVVQGNKKTWTGTYNIEGDVVTTLVAKSKSSLRRTGNTLVGDKHGTVWEKADVQPSGASQGSNASTSAVSPGSTGEVLTNADVLSLAKVGLGEELIAAKIKQAKAVAFDLSTDGLVALRKGGVTNTVIEAMMRRAAN
jgi:hypothetical protein